jgi:hypothetical protein
VITKAHLMHDAYSRDTGDRVRRRGEPGVYHSLTSPAREQKVEVGYLEVWRTELKLGVIHKIDSSIRPEAREAHLRDMISDMHRYMYGGVVDRLNDLAYILHRMPPEYADPALTKLKSLLKDLTEG